MALCAWRTSIKNRIQSLLAKYAVAPDEGLKVFSQHGRSWLQEAVTRLPPETGRCLNQQLELLDELNGHITRAAYLGSHMEYWLALTGQEKELFVIAADTEAPFSVGDKVTVALAHAGVALVPKP